MIDLPHYEREDGEDMGQEKTITAITSENADDIMAQINAMI